MEKTKIRTYQELLTLNSFVDRFRYLKLDGIVGEQTFGYDRYLNQRFYTSPEWRRIRDQVIIRDNGCDLAVPDHELCGTIYVHHMNPIMLEDFSGNIDALINPDYLICTSFETHNAIHYGDESLLLDKPTVRCINDTCPWKH